MAYVLKTNLANKNNYGGSRKTSNIKYIVIHYTSNDGDTDENNGVYFKNSVVKSSAHYFVDDDSVTQSVPDNYTAYHCGANKYKHATCRNANSIGIELCDDVKNGVVYPSAKTIENALELTEKLMEKYNVPKENVIRHYDVTGKLCPAYWSGSAEKNKKWLSEFWNKIGKAETPKAQATTAATATASKSVKAKDAAASFSASFAGTYKVTASALNVRHGAGTNKAVMCTIPKNTAVKCYGYYTAVLGTKWLYVLFTFNGVQYTGFCSSKYLSK